MKRLLSSLALSLLTISTAMSQSNQRVVTSAIVDTVDVVCHDLVLNTDFIGLFRMAYIFANNSEYELTGAINNVDSIPPGTYTDCMMDLKHIATQTQIPAVSASLTLAVDDNKNCVITGHMIGEDSIYYNLHLSWTPPTSIDTVKIAFDNSAWVAYYPDLEHDFMLSNQNDEYDIALDIRRVAMGNTFDEGNLNIAYCLITNKETNDTVKIASAEGRVWQSNDTTYLSADVAGFDAVTYSIDLWYAVPTVTQTQVLNISNATFYNALEKDGYFSLVGTSNDKTLEFAISLLGNTEEDIPGTYTNDGLFGGFTGENYDFVNFIGGKYATYIAKWNDNKNDYDLISIEKGQAKITVDQDKNVSLTGKFIGVDGVEYQITMTSKVDKSRFEDDAQSNPVDRVLTGKDGVTIDDSRLENEGIIRFEMMTDSELLAIWFIADTKDPDIIIPEGMYYIDNSEDYGSVIAADGSLGKTFYATHDGEYFTSLYFLLSGTVDVKKNEDKTLRFELNAINSYDVPVHIIYDATATGLPDIQYPISNARKILQNGQMTIICNGKAYNITGARVQRVQK